MLFSHSFFCFKFALQISWLFFVWSNTGVMCVDYSWASFPQFKFLSMRESLFLCSFVQKRFRTIFQCLKNCCEGLRCWMGDQWVISKQKQKGKTESWNLQWSARKSQWENVIDIWHIDSFYPGLYPQKIRPLNRSNFVLKNVYYYYYSFGYHHIFTSLQAEKPCWNFIFLCPGGTFSRFYWVQQAITSSRLGVKIPD